MFISEYANDDQSWNRIFNANQIKKIEVRDIRCIKGWEFEKQEEKDNACYEVKITFLDNSEELLEFHEPETISYFFYQLRRLGIQSNIRSHN